jgi:hypothetical protein
MYRRPKFLEVLIDIRIAMAEEADHDVAYFVQTLHQEHEVELDAGNHVPGPEIQQIVIPHEF